MTSCKISGESFEVSGHEKELRAKFGFGEIEPSVLPKYRFRELGAFWPQWNLYKRKSDKSGRPIVSIFRPDCPYPVWHRDEWIESAAPPSRDFDFDRPFFEQAWELFQKCPLPHAFQSNNENCEYTDDWYYSRNCYLCHSGQSNEDCRYSYGCDSIKDVHCGVFSFESELCVDLINSIRCFGSKFLLNCRGVSDSSFLYDCRDCRNCAFSFNLRNKEYCFGNEQLSKEDFEAKMKEWDFSSHANYEKAKTYFAEMMETRAWHRALQIDQCEDSTGNLIHNCKDCENCYMLSYHENCANVSFSGPQARSCLDSIGTVGSELSFMTSLPVYCYDARFCFSTSHCRFVQYSAYLQNCKNCFGCCGLVNQEYCIFNKKYSKEEYEKLVPKIIEDMKKTGEWGQFFPPHFAPNPYDESYSGFYFPLSDDEKGDFRKASSLEKSSMRTAELTEIPDSAKNMSMEQETWLCQQVFWDDKYKRPFSIQKADVDFCKRMNTPLPRTYYVSRMQKNLKWMPFNGELRETCCARSGVKIATNWPAIFDGRILSETEYLKEVR